MKNAYYPLAIVVLVTNCQGAARGSAALERLSGASPGLQASVSAINDAGEVAGWLQSTSGFFDLTIWRHGEPTLVAADSSIFPGQLSLNGSGDIAATFTSYQQSLRLIETRSVIVKSSGEVDDLPRSNQAPFHVGAMNDSGVIAGSLATGEAATLSLQTGVLVEYGRYDAAAARFTTINNAGLIGGTLSFVNRPNAQAFLLSSGTIHLLPDLGGDAVYPAAINSSGTLVGQAADVDGVGRAVTWTHGEIQIMPTPHGSGDAVAHSINDADQTVGSVWLGGGYHAVMWSEGNFIDLNTILPIDSGWLLNDATSINNLGQIVGTGTYLGQPAAFLLTPTDPAHVPEPAAGAATALLLAPAALARRQRMKSPKSC